MACVTTLTASIVCGTTAATCTEIVWVDWCNTTNATTATPATNFVWRGWVDSSSKSPVELTESQLRERAAVAEAAREAAETAREAAETAREAAEKRAKELLLELLRPEQRAELNKEKRFRVKGGDGAIYRINEGWTGNIEELCGDGKPVNRFCIHTQRGIPVHDNMIAQKLMLESQPDEFRRIANRTEIPVGAPE